MWVQLWAVVTCVGVLGTVVSVNNLRFAALVHEEAAALVSAASAPPAGIAIRDELPAPVRRYIAKATAARKQPVRWARLRHGGTFRTSLDGNWLPIRGEQSFTASPPGFVWWGRVRLAPGVWVDARDRSAAGAGGMLVKAESTITLADSRGLEMDQSALARLLGELMWFPTAFLDERYVRWTAVDDRRATATLTVNDRAASGELAFGPDDLPVGFSAARYRDIGGGTSVLTPFVGTSSDFRLTGGMMVPYRMVASWQVDGAVIDYARFEVDAIDFDQ